MAIRTFQDFEGAEDIPKFVLNAIYTYKRCDLYKTALLADEYDAQLNPTITGMVRKLFTLAARGSS